MYLRGTGHLKSLVRSSRELVAASDVWMVCSRLTVAKIRDQRKEET